MRVPRRRPLRPHSVALDGNVAIGEPAMRERIERPIGRAAGRERAGIRMFDEFPNIVIAGDDTDAG